MTIPTQILKPGALAPADGDVRAETPLLGPNNELLDDAKPHLVNALRELVRQYREEGIVARRCEIRRIRQDRLFWQGLHYAWWNPSDMNWHLADSSLSATARRIRALLHTRNAAR